MNAPTTPSSPPPPDGTKKLLLADTEQLSEGLLSAFERILGYARQQAARVSEDPKTSVHEFRKSIRRARALLKLMRDLIPPKRLAPLAEELRASVKETSILRDVDVLTGHAAGLADAPLKTALLAHLEERQAQQASDAATRVLGHAAARIEPIPGQLREALPEDLGPRTLHDALEKAYRRVQRSFRASALDPEDAVAVHTLRKRVKELRYSLELLRERVRSPEPLERLALFAEELGALTDINVLREYVREHPEELGGCDPGPLLARLDEDLIERTLKLQGRIAYAMVGEPLPWAEALLGPRPKKRKARRGK